MKTSSARFTSLGAAFWLACALILLSACNNNNEVNTKKTKERPIVGVLLYRADDAYVELVFQSLQSQMAGKADIIMYAAGEDQLTQDEQLEKLISAGVDALVVNLVDTQAAANTLDIIKIANLPVVFFNRQPDLNIIKSYNKACFVGSKNEEAGELQGKIIARLWAEHPEYDRNNDGKFQYVMLQGNPDNPEAIARTEYSVKTARELGVNMRQLGQTYVCNWDQSLAKQSMLLAMGIKGDKIELVISNNDAMALGALSAMANYGYNVVDCGTDKFIPVIGVDATPAAIAAIKRGCMSATVKQDGEAMAVAIGKLIFNIIDGRNFLADSPYSWDESGVSIRIPYSLLTHE